MTCVTALKVTVWAHLGFYELKGQIELEKNVLCVCCVLVVCCVCELCPTKSLESILELE